MSPHVLAALLIAWAVSGIVIGFARTDVAYAQPIGWAILILIWAACGPFAALLPRG